MKLALESFFCGVMLTKILPCSAFVVDSRAVSCVFVWQACLLQLVVHTPDNPMHEGSPIDLFAFAFGVLLGVPIYSLPAYYFHKRGKSRSRRGLP